MDLFAVGIGAAAAGLTYLVMPFAIVYLERREILDVPVERSSHSTVTIRGGGIAMVGPLVLGVLAARGLPWLTVVVSALSLLALAAIGLKDDEDGLGAALRFSLVFVIALVSGCAVLGISWEAAFGVFLLLAFVNAFNFMDGINRISGFTMLISGMAYGVIGSIEESQALGGIGFAIAGAGLGFLPFNFPSARVFMGDVGSYVAGGAIAISAMVAIDAGVQFLLAMSPLALYAVDTSTTLGRRILRGERFSEAHREHVYQRVAEKKGHVGGTILAAAASVAVIAAAFFGSRLDWPPPVVVVVMLIPAGCYLLAPNVLTKVGRHA